MGENDDFLTDEEIATLIREDEASPHAGPSSYSADDVARLAREVARHRSASKLDELTRHLARATFDQLVDVRFIRGVWCVMVPMGNVMVPVRGPGHDTPEGAMEHAIRRWEQRSESAPFYG